jgi:hypothetical protein
VFAFVKRPRDLLARVAGALKPGAAMVLHEYFDYSTWQTLPPMPLHEEFVRVVVESWRADGGEPNIGLDLPIWLEELGFRIAALNPIIDIIPQSSYVWQWPKSFLRVGLQRLVDLGRLTPEHAQAMSEAFAAMESSPRTRMITPAVLEIIAVRQ